MFKNYFKLVIYSKKSTFTPTSTPAIKNMLVYAINTA